MALGWNRNYCNFSCNGVHQVTPHNPEFRGSGLPRQRMHYKVSLEKYTVFLENSKVFLEHVRGLGVIIGPGFVQGSRFSQAASLNPKGLGFRV